MKNLLLVIDQIPASHYLVARARAMADAQGGHLYLYHAVYDPIEEINKYVGLDNFSAIRDELVRERQRQLEQLVYDLADDLSCRVEWNKRSSEGVVTWAEHISADCIVVAAGAHHLMEGLAYTPDDWNLLRRAPCPVMVLSPVEHPIHSVVAAVDCLDANELQRQLTARILDHAQAMAKLFRVPLNVVSVLPASSMKMALEARVPDSMNWLAQLEQGGIDQLQQTLDMLGIEAQELQVLEGNPERVIADEADQAGLLVIGSMARKGISGHLLGNTAERVLHRLQRDVLVVN
ncbi:universal stress protein [Porticoccus sp.]